MKFARYILVFLIFAAPAVMRLNASEDETDYEVNKARWAAMSEDEKSMVVKTYRRWKDLPDDDRHALRGKYNKFKALSHEQKLAVAVNAKRWVRLDRASRDRIRRYKKFRGHPPLNTLFRIVGLLMEKGKPVTRQSVAQRFRAAVKNAASKLLTDGQKRRFHSLKDDRAKRKFVFRVLSEKVKKENPERLRDLVPGSESYRKEMRRLVMRMFREAITESLPPSQMEMAHYFRRKAPRELLARIASVSNGDLDKVVRRIAEMPATKNLVKQMPEDMRRRFLSFSEEKRLATLKMALEPFGKLGRMRLRMFSNGHHHSDTDARHRRPEHRRGGRPPRAASPTPGPE